MSGCGALSAASRRRHRGARTRRRLWLASAAREETVAVVKVAEVENMGGDFVGPVGTSECLQETQIERLVEEKFQKLATGLTSSMVPAMRAALLAEKVLTHDAVQELMNTDVHRMVRNQIEVLAVPAMQAALLAEEVIRREDVEELQKQTKKLHVEILRDVEMAMTYKVETFEFEGWQQRLTAVEANVGKFANLVGKTDMDGEATTSPGWGPGELEYRRGGLDVGCTVRVDGLGGVASMFNGATGMVTGWEHDGKWIINVDEHFMKLSEVFLFP